MQTTLPSSRSFLRSMHTPESMLVLIQKQIMKYMLLNCIGVQYYFSSFKYPNVFHLKVCVYISCQELKGNLLLYGLELF